MESTVTFDPELTRPYVLGLLPPFNPFDGSVTSIVLMRLKFQFLLTDFGDA
jgi:hypothetical protein